jgi:3',5'-cyclic AMP phosphodiesterase CpdA
MRLAHFSDLHLLSLDGVKKLQYANKRWIGAMNLLSNRGRHYHTEAFDDMVVDLNSQNIDHIICTGDITNLAFAQEFAFARERFDKLTLGPSNVTVLPGNHDSYVEEGAQHYAAAFGAYYAPDDDWRWSSPSAGDRKEPGDNKDDQCWPSVRVRGDLALIGLSTSLKTPWFTAWGKVGQLQLARLRSVLKDARLAGKVRVVAIHHPPAGARAFSIIRGLRDHAAFADVIKDAGAELIIHGHEHRNMHEQLQGPGGAVSVLGVPSGTYEANKPERTARYRIIEIKDGQVSGHHMRVWDRQRKLFVHDNAPSIGATLLAPATV